MNVVVYDTLRRGGPANNLLMGAKFIKTTKIPGRLYNYGDFPAYKPHPVDKVVVDLYRLPERFALLMSEIDRYMGCHPDRPDESLFLRRLMTTEEGLPAIGYLYRFDVDDDKMITSGDWACC